NVRVMTLTRTLTHADGLAAVYGGGILGGGGGGHLADGLARVESIFSGALNHPELVSVEELSPDAVVACVAMVGAPSAESAFISDEQYISTVRLLRQAIGGDLAAVMTNENGPATTVNGWLQAAALGLPVLDAPANGRAHPTGVMGALQLHQESGYVSYQAFAGGRGAQELAGVLNGPLDGVAGAIRALSVRGGGMIGVCRNQVPVSRAARYGAVGGISFAMDLGAAFLRGGTGAERIANAVEFLGGRITVEGVVRDVELRRDGGFDVGTVAIDGDRALELSFWNEYMSAEVDGERLATFPDLIMTLDTDTGDPIVSARIRPGQRVTVITADKSQLPLGASMFDLEQLADIEAILGLPIVEHQ
ncbi:MAG: DUF917 domain-containing protein, partial [Galactobacter sp.]